MDAYKVAISRYALGGKIPPLDPFWPKFNASFDNLILDTEHLMQAIYNGQSITTWHKNNWRTSTNYLLGQHIGLDFDAGDKSSSIESLVKDKFIAQYAAFVYTTVSHTPEAPRARAIFLLDQPINQAKNYTLAASALLWLFGTADRQCKDAVRFFYGSKNCEFEYLANTLPLEVLKRLIQNYQETGAVEKRQSVRKDYLAPATQQEVAAALKFIPPWQIDYDEWVQVLMGIHAEFGEAGYALADSWADGKPGEVEQKWKSFRKDHDGSAVTVATVFGMAKKFGWGRGA